MKHICESGTEKKKRVTESTMNSLVSALDDINWNEVYGIEDVNKAYIKFNAKLLSCFEKCCPLTEAKIQKKYHKPWLTKGLINACRKKNYLYKCQLKSNKSETKIRYLTYKNKLTGILRKAEKQYYRDKQNRCKKDMKATWSILNMLIGKSKQKSSQCEFIRENGQEIHNGNRIANAFNDFYINVGPSLADKIDSSNVNLNHNDFLKDIEC